uniref:Protein kinase domain-containing protein n=1 Tax=Globisporangium ultimum (strain ATCC 200006 / CBS 805.95 / DAOM BR144) TaxID=431595 RepID=K3XDI6_GLOUD
MACKVLPALKFIFSLLQERRKTPVDIEVGALCAALSRFRRYLRTAVSEKSVFELTRSRQVAETHHVIYAELDRLLDVLEISETDSIRVWRSDEEPVTQNTGVTSSMLHRHGIGGDTSSGDVVVLNHFDVPFADHASWTDAGLTALNTPPSWVLPLRELLFSESDLIGQGAFGAIYKGSWLDTPVVVKFMGYEEDPKTISTDLLLHEVRVWYRLSHPHVLKLYGANHVDKRYFVCEFASN